MKIGIAGPMTLHALNVDFGSSPIPEGYDFPMVSWLINALIERGHRVVAYTASVGLDEPRVFKGKNLTVCVARYRTEHRARDLFRLERRDILKLMKAHPADIINAHWSYEFAWAAIDSQVPTLVTLQDHALSILKYQLDPYRLMRLIMNYIVIHRAQFLAANSYYLFDVLGSRSRRKARVIPNFYAKALEAKASTTSGKKNYIVSVCNGFGRRKNIETALRAFSLVRNQEPAIVYQLIGSGMEPGGPAERFALINGITDGVIFSGNLPHDAVTTAVRDASIFLHPAKEESFGVSVLEAMVLGTPVIGGKRSGNVPHLLEKGEAGEVCDVSSPQGICNAILKLHRDRNKREDIAIRARYIANAKYSERNVVPLYEKAYKDILDGRFFSSGS